MLLPQSFYDQKTQTVAQLLLGCFLMRKIGDMIIKTKIVETEAYDGPRDKASHASRGRTERNSIMFGHPGFVYVYFTYGMHHMLNIVTGKENYPAAVLIRAGEIVDVRSSRERLFGIKNNTNGPAKLTKILQVDRTFNHQPIFVKKSGLWIERGEEIKSRQIVKAKRIGVDYAEEYKDKLWRYYVKDNPFVSKRRPHPFGKLKTGLIPLPTCRQASKLGGT